MSLLLPPGSHRAVRGLPAECPPPGLSLRKGSQPSSLPKKDSRGDKGHSGTWSLTPTRSRGLEVSLQNACGSLFSRSHSASEPFGVTSSTPWSSDRELHQAALQPTLDWPPRPRARITQQALRPLLLWGHRQPGCISALSAGTRHASTHNSRRRRASPLGGGHSMGGSPDCGQNGHEE